MYQPFSPFGQFQGLGGLFEWQGQPQLPLQYIPRPQFFPQQPVVVTPPIQPPPSNTGTFVFTQATPVTTWTIDHPFSGQFPSVTLVDNTGKVIYGDIQFTSGLDQVIATFANPVSGKAFINV